MIHPDEIETLAEEPAEDENFELTEDLYVAPKIKPTQCPLCHSNTDENHKRVGDPLGRDRHTCSMCCG